MSRLTELLKKGRLAPQGAPRHQADPQRPAQAGRRQSARARSSPPAANPGWSDQPARLRRRRDDNTVFARAVTAPARRHRRHGLRYVEFVRGEQPVTPRRNGNGMIRPWPLRRAVRRPILPAGCSQFDLPSPPGHAVPAVGVARPNTVRHPYGETVSYLEIAQAIGNPKAVRAWGRQRPQP